MITLWISLKDLKKILSDWGEDTKGFTEKSEFIQRIEELKPKFAKPSAEL